MSEDVSGVRAGGDIPAQAGTTNLVGPAKAGTTYIGGPFLAWPVSRRAFYRAILLSLIPCLIWGVVLFGISPLRMLLASLIAATAMHLALKKTGWKRAQELLLFHSLVSVCILVALSHPTWPAWPVAGVSLLLPLCFALLGGPGKEPFHLAVGFLLLIQFVILPGAVGKTYTGGADALLVRDRLFMGDIRNQSAGAAVRGKYWPSSREVGGDDAFRSVPAAAGAVETLDAVSPLLPSDLPERRRSGLTPEESLAIRQALDKGFAFDLPPADYFGWGVTTGRLGTVSLIAIVLAGLHLSYRFILRPRSALIFLGAFVLVSAGTMFTWGTFARVGPLVLWDVMKTFPGQMVTLLQFMVLGSDALFAAVFILAMPGTEPLTPRGRRIFLVSAAFLAAAGHRYYPGLPTATMALTVLMPLARGFDAVFKHRSWLNG